ncbi:hypothetical protein KIN20_015992 [Parelaphostrongylus tenuis]|uniref:glucuronosyltransferase n=1 Tax=Parelaphostrongylus tenuis TaxID=148309 RepID=A0AAD5MJC6_PARTN|nr:hypothetical protein KIN20_015992 [Parelaphostrongylus tenuis]
MRQMIQLDVGVFLVVIAYIESVKVLFMPSTLYPMHSYTMKHLADELVHRNHQVTWLEYGPMQTKTSLAKGIRRVYWPVQFDNQIFNDIFVHRNHSTHYQIWNPHFELSNERTTAWLASVKLCDRLLTRSKAKFDDMVKERFDTVVVDDLYNPCGLLMVALKGSVYIYWSMTSLRTESAWANQSPSPPSYLPVHGTKLTEELSFVERIYNLASYLRALYIHQVIILPRIDAVFQKHYPSVAAAFDIERNASINFVNNPPIFDFARPYMPRVNFVVMNRPEKALPVQLQRKTVADDHTGTRSCSALNDFVAMASDDDGFVLITTGFTAQWGKAPRRIKDIYLATFRAYPKVRFIWQYDGTPFNSLPPNVFTQPWLPQQDLLGHPKCRTHISHGGTNSVIESVWHGIPTIGVPLTVAGHDNLLRISARGAGLLIPKTEFSPEKLIWALREIRKNKYKEEMLIFQDMVRDVPYTELTHAAFWVEFIERHQEVPHARSGADKLNFFQYFLVDVILFLISVLLLVFTAFYFIIVTSCRIIKYSVLLVLHRNAINI